MDEANPKESNELEELDFVACQCFDALTKQSKTLSGKTTFIFNGDTSQYDDDSSIVLELTEFLENYAKGGLLEYSDVIYNPKEHIVHSSITLNEPIFSNTFYRYVQHINNEKMNDFLEKTKYATPIQENTIYNCHLEIKSNTSDVFLRWDNNEEVLYHFENMSSPRYKIIKFLIEQSDMVHTLESLKAQYIVSKSTSRLHEFFSKTFLKGLLKDKFAIVTEKERIGLKSAVQLTGAELVNIIRYNLHSLNADQERLWMRNLKKTCQDLNDSLQLRSKL